MILAYNKITKQLTYVEHIYSLKPKENWVINPIISDYNLLIHTPTDKWFYNDETTELRVLTEEELDVDPVKLTFAKKEQIGKMSNLCEQEIIKGFSSLALGSIHWYDASPVDQLNLISSITLTAPNSENPNGTSIFYACRDNTDEDIKEYQSHNYQQLQMVMRDSAAKRLALLQKFSALRQKINEATCVTDVKKIEWE